MEHSEEARVFFRLVSGMHASISAHIAAKYLLDERWDRWGPSLPEFERRLGGAGIASRVRNLHFAYLFVLRAVLKAGPLLERFSYFTGVDAEDARAAQLIRELVGRGGQE